MDEHVANALREAYAHHSASAFANLRRASTDMQAVKRSMESAAAHQAAAVQIAHALLEGGALDEHLMQQAAQR